ncbi:MAG: UDP-N-acetylglucosamine 1-carboxyvinyltransferase [Candidatus Harrisonbacteria bacterium CG10_big_fil_rev_8_21_14_0_10_44_23]|uniref:UDP-N-acetylglucosamine 1-carboxyvinyltransferase n=1 Tax=Candidatus Harrisonbacteria bacterium CG10_big_fil_rev_8_21_14_0_10_44_23 TaxID=1974585 RepID=A0A2H0UQG7_9BACT|nr:MAG: UDP-N-acetylglucosamine 1-carboxyvinyltransferase [Candidatus Harrisonbacteria bacterium CG10_big_fil_rev_8_21_14_0_10_44_23]
MKNDSLRRIGKLIEDLRERNGLTQAQLAKSIHTSQSAVARMEKGQQNFSTEMLSRLSQAFGSDIFTLTKGTMNFQIEGGRKLHGQVTCKTSKNAAVGLLCASLLNKGKTTLQNMPRIEEVNRIIEVLQSIGAVVRWKDNDVEIDTRGKIDLNKIDRDAAIKTRSIIMFIGPLIHRLKTFKLPQVGGCKLGSRTVRPHFYAMEKLGVKIKADSDNYTISHKELHPAYTVLYESGDTVTENLLMAAALIPGVTTIKMASANYQVQDMCFFLEKLGVKIEGIGSTTLKVHGIKKIEKNIEYSPAEDPTEAMFFLAVAATTNSSIEIKRAPIEFVELELLKLEKMGFKYKISKFYKAKNGRTDLVDIQTSQSTLNALEEKIAARPFPGLNIDNLPFFAVISTQAEGQTLIHDWVYEKRALYYTELDKLGANTILADPHRIYINGPTQLKATELVCPPALRPATIILIGMLAAKGTSVLRNVYSINRGYEDLANRLNKMGAKVKIIHDF